MRRGAILVAACIGLGCCVVSLITARADRLAEAEIVTMPAPAHHMIGWKARLAGCCGARLALTGNQFQPVP
jgi:hypothetical protein